MKEAPGKLLSILHRRTQVYWTKTLKEFNITSAEYPVLFMLNCKDGVTQEEIVADQHIDKSAIARIIHSLEEKDYIIKKKDPSDLRCNRIYLTEKGKACGQPIEKGKEELSGILMQDMNEAEQEELLRLLNKMVINITKGKK